MMLKSSPTIKSNTGNGLLWEYLRLFREFRRQDLPEFCSKHQRLFELARQSGDYVEATRHYYSLMASLIATYYGEGWHFCPPEYQGQNRSDATRRMYHILAGQLGLQPGTHSLDIGCGVGGMLRFLGRQYGATMTGLTLGDEEVEIANRVAKSESLDGLCHVVQGNGRNMPFDDGTFDSAYAVYALKYYPDLSPVFAEIRRVLRPGGRFAAYCLCKSRNFNEQDQVHAKLLSDFEYSTAMPPLHSVAGIMQTAERHGLTCIDQRDLSTGKLTWYSYWVRNPLMPWMVSSRTIYALARVAEAARILPRGFAEFNDTFLAGTLRHIIRSGRLGILTGSAMLTFKKE
jgi:ubiquinone/menaquinone biosynthesis C-methylase UbiE